MSGFSAFGQHAPQDLTRHGYSQKVQDEKNKVKVPFHLYFINQKYKVLAIEMLSTTHKILLSTSHLLSNGNI